MFLLLKTRLIKQFLLHTYWLSILFQCCEFSMHFQEVSADSISETIYQILMKFFNFLMNETTKLLPFELLKNIKN